MKSKEGDLREKIQAVAKAKTDDLLELVRLSGYDPAIDFRYRDLNEADFGGCDLAGFDFTGSRLTNANFRNAKIAGAILDGRQRRLRSVRFAKDYDSTAIISENEFYDLIAKCELNKNGLKSFRLAFNFSRKSNIVDAQKVAILKIFSEKYNLHSSSLRRAVREISSAFEISNFSDQWLRGFLKDPRSYAIHRNTAAAIMLHLAKIDKFSYSDFKYVIGISNPTGQGVVSDLEMFPSITERLISACWKENTPIVENILNQFRDQIDIDYFNENRGTPLSISITKKNYHQTELVLNAGANPAFLKPKHPILLVSEIGDRAILNLLLSRGADANQISDDQETPLIICCNLGYTDAAESLIQYGADVNFAREKDGMTPLIIASRKGHSDIVVALTVAGVDANQIKTKGGGSTALLAASYYGHHETVNALISAGANVKQTRKSDGFSPIMAACNNKDATHNHLEVIRLLVQFGADLEARTTRKSRWYNAKTTALMLAAFKDNSEIVKFLLESGVEIDAQTSAGKTALMHAAQNGNVRVCQQLIKFGANLSLTDRNELTAADYASQKAKDRDLYNLLRPST